MVGKVWWMLGTIEMLSEVAQIVFLWHPSCHRHFAVSMSVWKALPIGFCPRRWRPNERPPVPSETLS